MCLHTLMTRGRTSWGVPLSTSSREPLARRLQDSQHIACSEPVCIWLQATVCMLRKLKLTGVQSLQKMQHYVLCVLSHQSQDQACAPHDPGICTTWPGMGLMGREQGSAGLELACHLDTPSGTAHTIVAGGWMVHTSCQGHVGSPAGSCTC